MRSSAQLDVVQTVGVAEPQEALAVAAERRARQARHAGFLQQPIGQLATADARAGDVRKGVEGALGLEAAHAGQLRSARNDGGAPRGELLEHARRPASCGPSSAAMAACWAKLAVQLTELEISRSTCGTSSAGKTPKPSRQPVIAHVLDQPSRMIVRSSMPSSVAIDSCWPVYRMRAVDLVGQDDDVALAGDVGDDFEVGAGEHAAGRVVGRVDDDQPGLDR